MQSDQPATIPAAAAAFAATLGPFFGWLLTLDPAGIVALSAVLNTGVALALALYLNKRTTSSSAPVVEAGTEVAIKGSSDTVIAQPTPPGPEGIEGGSDDNGQ